MKAEDWKAYFGKQMIRTGHQLHESIHPGLPCATCLSWYWCILVLLIPLSFECHNLFEYYFIFESFHHSILIF